MPDTPTIEPTERSIPAVRITKVMPMAMNRVDRDMLGDDDERRQIEEIRSRQTEEGEDHDERNERAKAHQQQRERALLLGGTAPDGSARLVMLLVLPWRPAGGNSALRLQ